MNGTTGIVYLGQLDLIPADPDRNEEYKELMTWADEKRKLKINTKLNFTNAKLAAAFHHHLSLKQQLKIKKFIKRMQFPCFDALTYCQLAEGRLEMVAQCANKIWDIHPIIPIVRASGAIITTWGNKNPVAGGNIIISNNKKIDKSNEELIASYHSWVNGLIESKTHPNDIYFDTPEEGVEKSYQEIITIFNIENYR